MSPASFESVSPGPHRGLTRWFARPRGYRRMLVALVAASGLLPLAASPRAQAQQLEASEIRRTGDASVDRNVLLPSAETLPEGAVAFNSYELILAGVSYGIKDHLELSATTLLPITSDIPFFLALNLKWNFYRSAQAVVSLAPSGFVAREDGLTIGGFGASLIADRILDQAGRFTLTGGVMTNGVFGGEGGDFEFAEGALLVLWSSFSARFGDHFKLLAEMLLPGGYTWAAGGDFELVEEGLILGYGVRFFGRTLAVDLTFLRPVHPDVDTGSLVMGLPFVAFSAQF